VSIEFPLPRRWSPFGLIVDPKILIEARTLKGYRGHHFLVDTGADLSVAPRSAAEEVGLDRDSLPTIEVTGVGRRRVTAKLGTLPIRIDQIDLSVRCLFMDQREAPYILGCADVLDRFASTIDAGRNRILFTEIA
jgi:predicted aspartyl protease